LWWALREYWQCFVVIVAAHVARATSMTYSGLSCVSQAGDILAEDSEKEKHDHVISMPVVDVSDGFLGFEAWGK